VVGGGKLTSIDRILIVRLGARLGFGVRGLIAGTVTTKVFF
jgi:hypothetical protein